MADFLLELRSEEIPARMQAGARAHLSKLFLAETAARGLHFDAVPVVWSTPRRLALLATGLPPATAAVSEEIKGPKVSAPAQALDGFLRKTGLTRGQLTQRDGVWFAVTEKPARATAEVLAEAIPAIIRSFPWPKSMRWGAASLRPDSLRWVRPLSGIVALLDEAVIPFEIDGIRSGATTRGHRFHAHGEITIASPASYSQSLGAHHVIVDHAARETIIRDGAGAVAAEAGLVLVADEGLVVENAGLTEWPVPLLGRFDAAFLAVPPEVIQLTARTNQKYFICRDGVGRLANAFICTANIVAVDGGAAIVAGNRKVLAARLADARFFWDQDRKKPLAQHVKGLSRITFHEKLGTVADKVERVAQLARWLVEEGIVPPSPLPFRGGAGGGGSPDRAIPGGESPHPNPSPAGEGLSDRAALADLAEQAARFCKADLVTEMVGEFPELQGLMGGHYARAEGLPDAVADAIRDHYKPVGQGDEVPTAPVTVAVSLADKLDTLVGFFYVDQRPTGSRDPFALRRAALGVIELITINRLRLAIFAVINRSLMRFTTAGYSPGMTDEAYAVHSEALHPVFETLPDFIAERLKVQQRDAGIRHDLIDAVFALGGEDDLVRLLARVQALQSFIGSEDGTNLLAGYKRAANILKKEGFATPAQAGVQRASGHNGQMDSGLRPNDDWSRRIAPTLTYTPEPAEAALIAALESATPHAEAAIAAEDFAGAMAALSTLRAPIDAFFEQVTVNDPDQIKRAARLALLDQFRAAVHKAADFSRIEG